MPAHSITDSLPLQAIFIASSILLPIMLLTFFGGMSARFLIYYTIWREMSFAKEFDKRVANFLESTDPNAKLSFYQITKKLLEKTFYELFVVRAIMKRRNPDIVMTMSDRVFLTKQGAAWIVHDMLKQFRLLKHEKESKLGQITRNTLQTNPCFNKVFGIFPTSTLNELTNLLPSLLILGGIFGTFLGIMKALPQLGLMDLQNVGETQQTMSRFLQSTSEAMVTSILGIFLSIVISIWNSVLSPEYLFLRIVDRFESGLEKLWSRSDNNDLPKDLGFDENRDPLEALAEESLQQELEDKNIVTRVRKKPAITRDAS